MRLVWLLLLFPVYAGAVNVSFTLAVNPDGTYDTAYPAGNKGPASATLAWDNSCLDTALGGLTSLTTGVDTTIDVRTNCLTGTAKATATLGVTHVSGDADWSISGSDNLFNDNTPANAGSGVIRLTATDSGETANSNNYSWLYQAAASGDTTAPPVVRGLVQTGAAAGQVTLEWDESCDVYDGEAASGTELYNIYVDTSLDSTTAATDCGAPQLTQTIVGSSDGTPSSTQSGVDWALSFAGTGIDTGDPDNYLFRGTDCTGDCFVSAKMTSLTGGDAFAKQGVIIASSVSVTDSALCTANYQKNGRAQSVARTVTGNSTIENITQVVSEPIWVALRYTQSNDTCTAFYSTDGLGWTELGSRVIPMPATVKAGAFITGNTATSTNATGNAEELNIHSVARKSHDLTIASSGTVTISADDFSDNESAQSAGITATPGATGGTLKWHPGYYMLMGGGDYDAVQSNRFSQYDTIANNTDVTGVTMFLRWPQVESTENVYDFTMLDAEVNYVKNLAVPKRLIIRMNDNDYGDTCSAGDTSHWPSYIISGGYTLQTNLGCVTERWNQAYMDHYIDLIEAICTQYNDEPYVEAIQIIRESAGSWGGTTPPAEYSDSAVAAQFDRLMDAASAACTKTIVVDGINHLSQSVVNSLIANTAANPTGGTGQPDSCPTVPSAADNTRYGNAGGVDYRGVIPYVTNLEGSEMGIGSACASTNYTPTEITNWANTNKVTHLSVRRHVPNATTGYGLASSPPCDDVGECDWAAWLIHMQSVTLTNTSCPTGVTQGCNTD